MCEYSTEYTREPFAARQRSVWLSSPVFCPSNSSCLGFTGLPAPCSAWEDSRLCLGPLLPGHGNVLQALSWGCHRAHLTWFLSLRGHYPSCPDVQCLKSHYFTYFIQYFVLRSKVNMTRVTVLTHYIFGSVISDFLKRTLLDFCYKKKNIRWFTFSILVCFRTLSLAGPFSLFS